MSRLKKNSERKHLVQCNYYGVPKDTKSFKEVALQYQERKIDKSIEISLDIGNNAIPLL